MNPFSAKKIPGLIADQLYDVIQFPVSPPEHATLTVVFSLFMTQDMAAVF
jgi:hypothetical protein